MDYLILKKINDKLRIDFPDEFIENSTIKHEGYNRNIISENIPTLYTSITYVHERVEEHDIPDNIKELFLSSSNIYPKKEFDPLDEPMITRNVPHKSVDIHDLSSEEKIKTFGLY